LALSIEESRILVKIAVIATHPIQYHVPWFIALSEIPGCTVKVYFACQPDDRRQGVGFDQPFSWDIPMYDGYDWQVLDNRRKDPGVAGFFSSSVRNLADILRCDRPEVLILTGWQGLPLLQALWSAVRLGIPRVVRGESSGLKPRNLAVNIIHRLLLSQYDAFLVIGESNNDFYARCGIPDSKLFSCPYFVENRRIRHQARLHRHERMNLRSKWGIPPDSICYLYVGKLTHTKRVLDQLAALKLAHLHNRKLHLLIVGTGELMGRARKYADEHKLPVSFAGFLNQTEVTSAYAAADCLILSSDYETWGLVVNEAMVCGLPAIVSDRVGCGPDLVRSGETGEKFAFGSVDVLSQKMLSMAESRDRLTVMGECARELVLRHYTVESAVEGTIKAVESVLR
jgi:glycosyltransferase involved in cell wall biosynthesis